MGKIFSTTSIELEIFRISLKCNPLKSADSRENFKHIAGASHMNKTHWEIIKAGMLLIHQPKEIIDHSHHLVTSGFTKKTKTEFDTLSD